MIDTLVLAVLIAGSIYLVNRVRREGFGSLRLPSEVVFPLQRALAARVPGASEAIAESDSGARGAFGPRFRIWTAAAPRLVEAPPPRFVIAWVGGVALVFGAILLQRELWTHREGLTPLWILLGVGALFAVGVRVGLRLPYRDEPSVAAAPAQPSDFDPLAQVQTAIPGGIARFGGARRIGQGLLAAALLAELAALQLFPGGQQGALAWLLHVLAVAAFLPGLWFAISVRWLHLAGTWSRVDTAILIVVILCALVPRVWQLGTVPQGIWFDEGERGNYALRILADPGYRPVFLAPPLGEPATYVYFMVPFVQLLGRDALAVRLPEAIIGALGVGALYLLARLLFDRRTAFLAAGLTVGMTWHLNFSRVAFPAMYSVAFDVLTAFLFALGLRRKSVFAFGAAGLSAGIAMHFYYTSRVIPLILAVIVLHLCVSTRLRVLRECGAGFAIAAVAFLLASAPVAQYALQHPQAFMARVETINVMKEVEQAQSWEPLTSSIRAHLLMFNYHGDNNGRHNWTGRPMLDGVTGALFILGLFLALTHWRRWEYALPLVWFPAILLGGILSLSWEAPQAHRAVDDVTAIALFAALPLAVLWRASDRLIGLGLSTAQSAARSSALAISPAATALIVGVVVATGAVNVHRYFTFQARDHRTWSEFSTPHTEAGRMINEVPLGWKIYVDPHFVGYPSMTFMMTSRRDVSAFDPSVHLPVTDEGAAIFLSEREAAAAARIAALYPAAERRTVSSPDGGAVGLYSFWLTPLDVQSARGVAARYGSGDSAVDRLESAIDFAWPAATPVQPPFPALLESTLAVQADGRYGFRLEGPSDAVLTLNGEEVARGGGEGNVLLARGTHALRVEAPAAGLTPLRAFWSPPQAAFEPLRPSALFTPSLRTTGLLARIYRGTETGEAPVIQRVDTNVQLVVHLLPAPRPYTIEWTGAVRAARAGDYVFGTTSVDASAVWVDGSQIVDNRTLNTYQEGSIRLSEGWHDIRVRFLDATTFTHVTLYWQPPGEGRTPVPTEALRPWPADRVQAAEPRISVFGGLIAGDIPQAQAGTSRQLAGADVLSQPRGVAVGLDGTVYVADAGRKAIVAVPLAGEPRLLAEGQLREPSAVAVGRDRAIYALDAAGGLLRIEANGTTGEPVPSDQSFFGPRGLAVAPDGRVAVADTGNNRIVLLSPAGGPSQVVGGVREPTDVAFLPDGNLLIAETGAQQVAVLKLDGQRDGTWPMPRAYTVVGPHVAVLPRGGWVVTAPEERALLRMASGGREPQAVALDANWRKPVGVAVGPAGVVVADAEGARVVLVGLP